MFTQLHNEITGNDGLGLKPNRVLYINLKDYIPALMQGADINLGDQDITFEDMTLNGDSVIGDTAGDTTTVNATGTFNTVQTFSTNVKLQFRDTGIYLQSSSDGVLNIVSDTTVAISGAVTMDSTLTLTGKLALGLNGGAASASGLLMGVGTTANPATTAAANNMFAEFRTQSTATSGDSRGLYWRHDLNGAGVSGESIRNFTKVTGAAATARGSHTSLDIDVSTGSVSGLGAGVDAQVLVGDGALTGGTYTAVNSEIYSAGSSTDVSAVTGLSFFRAVMGGDATGIANVDDKVNLITVSGGSIASGNMVEAETDETKFSHKIRININGTTYYLMATAT